MAQIYKYLLNTFIRPVSVGDVNIFIRDEYGHHRFEISPTKVTATYVDGKIVNIKMLGTDQVIKLQFSSSDNALLAMKKFNAVVDTMKTTLQTTEEQELEELIEGKVKTEVTSQLSGINMGATGSMGATGAAGLGAVNYYEEFTNKDTWIVCPDSEEGIKYSTETLIFNENGQRIDAVIQYVGNPVTNYLDQIEIYFNQEESGFVVLVGSSPEPGSSYPNS